MIEAMKAPLINTELASSGAGVAAKGEVVPEGAQLFAELFSGEIATEESTEEAVAKAVVGEDGELEVKIDQPVKKLDVLAGNKNAKAEVLDAELLTKQNLGTTEDFISQKDALKNPLKNSETVAKTTSLGLEPEVALEQNTEAKTLKTEESLKSEKNTNLFKNFGKAFTAEEGLVKAKSENVVAESVKTGAAPIRANVFSLNAMVGDKKESNISDNTSLSNTKSEEQPTLAKILDFKPTTVNPEVAVLETGKAEGIDNKAPTKVLDLSSLQMTNNTTKTEIIQKIADYIQTNQLANQSEVELTVKHHELGTFQINVQKMKGAQDIKMSIATNEQEGFKFFQKFEGDLIRNLENAGIKVADFKLSTTQTNFTSSFSQDSTSKDGQSGRQQWSESSSFKEESWQKSSSDDRRQDSDRRRDIWAQYRERFGA